MLNLGIEITVIQIPGLESLCVLLLELYFLIKCIFFAFLYLMFYD